MKNTNFKKLRGAIIGYGFISSKGHLPAYLERIEKKNDVEITSIVDICEARRRQAHVDFPRAKIYAHYQELLAQEGSKLDFIDLATPPCDHAEIAIAGLAQGLHVLCEKPLTTTLTSAREMLEKAKTSQRVLFPCHNYKHAPVIKAIREILESNRIGRVRSVTLNTYRNTHAKGVTQWNTNWRREHRYSGGGIAMDHGSHTFYLTFDWLKSYPTAVTAKMSNLEPTLYDTEDNFTSVLTFPTGLAHVHLTWTAGVRKVIYTLQGEKGAITVDDDEIQIAEMQSTSGPEVAQGAVTWKIEKKTIVSDWMDASHVSWFNSLFDQFQKAISQGEYVGKEAQEAFLCIQLIEASYQSARENCQEKRLGVMIC